MRLPFNRIIRKVTKYRLGYNVQRGMTSIPLILCGPTTCSSSDYPGHWTTPVVLFVYMALATFLALMNSEIVISANIYVLTNGISSSNRVRHCPRVHVHSERDYTTSAILVSCPDILEIPSPGFLASDSPRWGYSLSERIHRGIQCYFS